MEQSSSMQMETGLVLKLLEQEAVQAARPLVEVQRVVRPLEVRVLVEVPVGRTHLYIGPISWVDLWDWMMEMTISQKEKLKPTSPMVLSIWPQVQEWAVLIF